MPQRRPMCKAMAAPSGPSVESERVDERRGWSNDHLLLWRAGRPARTVLCVMAALKTTQDDQLLRAVQKSGRNWKAIRDQRFFGRSRNDVKNRYTILIRRGSSSTLVTLADRNTIDVESDEDDDQHRFINVAGDDDDEEEEEDNDDEDEDDGDDNNNTNNGHDDDILKTNIGFAAEETGQDPMGLDQYLTPFPSFGFTARAATITPTEHIFSLPFSVSNDMHLDTDRVEHNYPFEATPDHSICSQ
ncbi:hypothetical protein P153DRAFT_24356 [Dothidotthia symphoricarpi CBS 119687]|uniref:HTH myb-type domain-containing protein n=1 Tax=Dothidotthia symphoricarpi CBS 119687 TaxID=1392245 RepID=A0A6A6AEH5_9PLEO|nr:uncharacterized protein P153DRAFT_24356 [Dothidotthia symphoricarpi CBS 119687]KAF2129703.1 hypothetical protein P153DRAFT_24356 [Dothidotthia symphoricarpi CBS 119687]